MNTPVQAVVGALYRGIMFGRDELSLPAQAGAEIRMVGVEAIGF
jgi:hypothetical protein